MKSLIYVIEAGDACDVPVLRDAFTRDVYGSTLLEKNLKLLKKDFSTIRVILWIRPALRDEIERELKDFLAAGKLSLQVDADFEDVAGSMPRTWLEVGVTASTNAILFQRGMRLLERLDSGHPTYHCIPIQEAGAPLLASGLQMRKSFPESENFCFLIQEQRSCEALETGAYCVSISEVGGQDFLATDTPIAAQLSSYLHAKAGLRSMDGPVSRLLLRNFSQYLSRPLSRWGVHPNVATLAAAGCALFAILLFTFDSKRALVAGGFMWMIGGLLDEVDGELARLQGKESEFGAWLDLTFDRMLDGLALIALAWPVVVLHPAPHLMLLIACAITLVATNSYIGLLYDGWMKNVQGRTVYFRIGRDTRNLIIFLCAIFSFRIEAIWIAGGISFLEILRRLIVCYRMDPTTASKTDSSLNGQLNIKTP